MLLTPKLGTHAAWLALALPFAALSWRLHVLSDQAASRVGAELAALAAPLAPSTQPEDEPLELFSDIAFPLEAPVDDGLPAKRAGRHARRSKQVADVRVSAARVLALAERRALPHATPVPANGVRPAGLQLRGVSALGLGVRDGDVLTDAAGTPALSAAAVVGVVVAARTHHASEISGRIFRGAEPYTIVVEQPYQLTPAP
ncbi:MAG TPA: hypothetical protein VGM29_07295 [Polyangiaceae bacterium]|jgi:hypothetical protein